MKNWIWLDLLSTFSFIKTFDRTGADFHYIKGGALYQEDEKSFSMKTHLTERFNSATDSHVYKTLENY